MVDCGHRYVGEELENFSVAQNWKRYWGSMILPYLGKRVLEVGAGIGSSTRVLASLWSAERWVCLEPDPANVAILEQAGRSGRLPPTHEFRRGTIHDLTPQEHFDSILYIDVLEHIDDDRAEIEAAADRLAAGGHLIILAPACPFMYSEFDRAIGHVRRYTRRMFPGDWAAGLRRVRLRHLDSVGLLPSLANRILLRSSLPSRQQLLVWDRLLVPVSRVIDWFTRYRIGRSLLAVYRRAPEVSAA